MNMSMKNVLMRITLHLINLKIQEQKQHHLVLQKKTSTRLNMSPTSEKESTQTTHTTEMSTAESTKHCLR